MTIAKSVVGWVLLLGACFFRWGQDHWWSGWAYVVSFMGLYLIIKNVWTRSRYLTLVLAFLYLHCVYFTFWRDNAYAGLPDGDRLVLENLTLTVLVLGCVLLGGLLTLKEQCLDWMRPGWRAVHLATGVSLIFDRMSGGGVEGLFANGSMSGCLVAVTAPFLWERLERGESPWFIFSAVAVWCSQATTPLVCFLAVLLSYTFIRYRKYVWGFIPGAGLLLVAAVWAQGWPQLASSNGRSALWGYVWQWWVSSDYRWLGTGLGTAASWLAVIQDQNKWFDYGWYIWLHNDWFQILVETGALGLILCAGLYGLMLWRVRRSPALFAATTGYGVMMLANYPWHLGVHAALGCWLIAMIFSLRH